MPYTLFYEYFPEIAEKETRTITLLDDAKWGLPPGNYAFLEMYCDEPGCDCRRVFFCVMLDDKKTPEAVIAYGWENRKFYVDWMGDDDPLIIDDLKGPSLNLSSPQSPLAPALLNLANNVLLRDKAYMDRIKRHYAIFRKKIDPGGKPARKNNSKQPKNKKS